jgi:hypothetical protein
MKRIAWTLALTLLTAPGVASAQEAKAPLVNPEAGVPVFAGDITDRPYTVIGEVKAGVRKATIFSKSSSEGKIYRELWERARKMGGCGDQRDIWRIARDRGELGQDECHRHRGEVYGRGKVKGEAASFPPSPRTWSGVHRAARRGA